MLLKKIYLIIDKKRENIEDFIANDILKKWDEYKDIDDIRRAGSIAVINAVCIYANQYGLPAVSDDIKEQIADVNVKILKKLNRKFQKQLLKKSKIYKGD